MSNPWEYDRATVPAIQQYVDRELLTRFDEGWLLHATHDTPGTETMLATVTFVFKRPRVHVRPQSASRTRGTGTSVRRRTREVFAGNA